MVTISREFNGVKATIFVEGDDGVGWSWWWSAPKTEQSGRMEGKPCNSSSDALEEAIRNFEWVARP